MAPDRRLRGLTPLACAPGGIADKVALDAAPRSFPADAPPILLDVTRLVSRLGTGPLTGIDRVEAAWLAALAGRPHLLLARVRRRQLVLPPAAGGALLGWLGGAVDDLPPPDLLDRLRGRRDLRARAGAALRSMALALDGPGGRGLARRIRAPGQAWAYVNVGHSNLTAPLWSHLGFAQRVLLVHDTIPLDFPQYTRAGQPEAFARRLTAALSHADLIVAISDATAADVARWRSRLGVTRAAPVIVAPIGTTLVEARPAELPPGLDLSRPYFVALGTIEPRKNIDLLLDAWERLGPSPPRLLIVGRRGWASPATLARLDALPPGGPVEELSGLTDGAVAALLDGARALLMPSRAEGFGLPLTEAAARGVPIIAAPLPLARALPGDLVQILPPDDPGAWANAIASRTAMGCSRNRCLDVPSWKEHFGKVLKNIIYMGHIDGSRG